jgi:hypothetical protein
MAFDLKATLDRLADTQRRIAELERGAWSGDSLAAPIVTGLACLLLERWPDLTLAQLEAELMEHAENLNLPKDRQGAGRAKLSPKLWS